VTPARRYIQGRREEVDVKSDRIREVVIVGAGIAGPVLGMFLKRLGVHVVIAEARARAALGEGAFLGVAPNGMRVLDELGVARAVSELGHACDAFDFRNRDDRRIGFIDRSDDAREFGWALTMVRRGELHVVLAQEAVRRGVEVRFGKRLTEVDDSRFNRVTARFADGSEATGDILIGADGLRSTTRALVLPDSPEPRFTGLLDFGGFAPPCPGLPFSPRVNEMVFGRHAFFGAFVTPSGETWWFHNGPDGEPTPLGHRARILDLHREDPPWIAELVEATPQVLGPWPIFELGGMRSWSRGRVCLVGDAAHAMSPSAGQGASLAMEDALVLSQCLRDVADPVRAFEVFERRRRPRVDAIFKQAQRTSNSKAVQSRAAEWLRDRMMPIFLRLGARMQTRSYAYRVAWDEPASSVG
jgi:FAD-dependent urate hydroxylase